MSHYDVEYAALYRGRILANLRHYWFTGWHWVYLAPGFCTIGNWNWPNEVSSGWDRKTAKELALLPSDLGCGFSYLRTPFFT